MSTIPSAAQAVPLRQDAQLIALVGAAHSISHYSQLLLAPLFPWLKEDFQASYTELGLLLTVFFVVSCAVQAASGFVVDRFGPRPVLFGGLFLIAVSAFGFSVSQNYWMLLGFSMVAGVGNGVFHPVDYTLINHKVSPPRLGHAYSVHGITGSLGWALAPAMLVPLAIAWGWRIALVGAGVLTLSVLGVLWIHRDKLAMNMSSPMHQAKSKGEQGGFDFLRIPAVWMCFAFFLFYAMALGVVQAFAPEAARQLHQVPVNLVAMCLTVYMVAAATGMVGGGFLASNPERCEKVVGVGFGLAACVALALALIDLPGTAVPLMFGLMGLVTGMAGPSRDMLVKRSTPENATGRVYGVVYAGLDIGQAVSPLIFGRLMDRQQYGAVLVGLAVVQTVLIASAFNVRRVRRTARLTPA